MRDGKLANPRTEINPQYEGVFSIVDITPSMSHWKQMSRALFDWYRQEDPDEEKVSNEAIWRKVRKQMAHNFPKAQFLLKNDSVAELPAKNQADTQLRIVKLGEYWAIEDCFADGDAISRHPVQGIETEQEAKLIRGIMIRGESLLDYNERG